ncbi:unnamed protein product, partial [Rotaria sp. Silwood2]
MSAAIEIDKLAHYVRQVINGQIVPAYQFQIGDRLFDVQDMYLEHIQNYGLYHTKNLPIKRATVLVFLPGLLEIQIIHETVRFPRGKPDS